MGSSSRHSALTSHHTGLDIPEWQQLQIAMMNLLLPVIKLWQLSNSIVHKLARCLPTGFQEHAYLCTSCGTWQRNRACHPQEALSIQYVSLSKSISSSFDLVQCLCTQVRSWHTLVYWASNRYCVYLWCIAHCYTSTYVQVQNRPTCSIQQQAGTVWRTHLTTSVNVKIKCVYAAPDKAAEIHTELEISKNFEVSHMVLCKESNEMGDRHGHTGWSQVGIVNNNFLQIALKLVSLSDFLFLVWAGLSKPLRVILRHKSQSWYQRLLTQMIFQHLQQMISVSIHGLVCTDQTSQGYAYLPARLHRVPASFRTGQFVLHCYWHLSTPNCNGLLKYDKVLAAACE